MGWTSRRGALVAILVAAGLCAAGLGVGYAVRNGPSHPPPADGSRLFNLAGGDRVAVSHGNGRLQVQWRHDGAWSKPQVLLADPSITVLDLRVRVGGPTLALRASLSPDDTTHTDDPVPAGVDLAADDTTLVAVCRDRACTTTDPIAGTVAGPPQVTPTGSHAFFGALADGYPLWTGKGIDLRQPTGLPAGDRGDDQPLLAADGGLRAVVGRAAPGGCDYTLFTTAPGSAAFTESAAYQDPNDRRRTCRTSLETFSDDYVVVAPGRGEPWFLARENGVWRQVGRDPSGQVHYPPRADSQLAGQVARSGFWHWREVVATSPDGRRLVVQVHEPGEARWGPPLEVLEAPEGSRCRSIDPMPTYTWGEEDPFYLHLTCLSESGEWIYPTVVSEDGVRWDAFLASASGIRVGRDMFFEGSPSRLWTPDAGLQVISLPVPDGASVTPLEGGGFALAQIEREGRSCELVVSLSEPDGESWSAPVPSTARAFGPTCAIASASQEHRNVYYYLGSPRDRPNGMIRLVWRDDRPVLEDGPGFAD